MVFFWGGGTMYIVLLRRVHSECTEYGTMSFQFTSFQFSLVQFISFGVHVPLNTVMRSNSSAAPSGCSSAMVSRT